MCSDRVTALAQAGFRSGKHGKTPADLLVEIGPTLKVDVGLKSTAAPGAPPLLAAIGLWALIDTGGGGNAIDETLARDLKLPLMEEGEVSGIHGRAPTNYYLARVYVPSVDRLLFETFTGARLAEGGQPHRAILGRTFLRQYTMIYDGPSGGVELA